MNYDQNSTLQFGKHKGKSLFYILVHDPDYAQWLCSRAHLIDRFPEE